MKRMNLPDTQELIWFVVGIWVTFFVARMIKARNSGIVSFLMYFFIAAVPPAVIIFQDLLVYWLQEIRGYMPTGK